MFNAEKFAETLEKQLAARYALCDGLVQPDSILLAVTNAVAAARHAANPTQKEPDPNCPWCLGEGVVDSDGVTPWDAPIDIRCGCTYPIPEKK